jgi:DNA-binding transcriptional ArsR family regulator
MDNEGAVVALGALAQEHRLSLFRQLVQAGPEGMAAGAIAEALGIPASSLSFHLSQLQHARLIHSERRSRSILYRADIEALRALMLFLAKDCCGGRAELCRPLADELLACPSV